MSDQKQLETGTERHHRGVSADIARDRERLAAEFLVGRLREVPGVTRIYSCREGAEIRFTVEVADYWGAVREVAHTAFYDIARALHPPDIDMRVAQQGTFGPVTPDCSIWFEGAAAE